VAVQIWSGKWRKTRPTADFTIHRCHEKPGLCSTFLLKPLIKILVGLCESCRGVVDLQLWYSPFGALLFKILEKQAVERALNGVQTAAGALERGDARDVVRPAPASSASHVAPAFSASGPRPRRAPRGAHAEAAHAPRSLGACAPHVLRSRRWKDLDVA
jgi:hypothetical protein